MRVICIDTPKTISGLTTAKPLVVVGEPYNVIDELLGSYELQEHVGYMYAIRLFIPLSDISETEFERNYKLEKQLQ